MLRQAGNAGTIAVNTPRCCAQQQFDAGIHCGFKRGHAHEDSFEHAVCILGRCGHPPAKIQRYIIAHQSARNGVFIDQQHFCSGFGRVDRRRDAAWPRANNNGIIMRFRSAARSIYRA